MEPFSFVLSVLAGPAIQALFTGGALDAKDWSGVIGSVLQALTAERPTTEQTLARIEQSIANDRAAASGDLLRAGLDFLEEARADWCPPDHRDRLLHEALNRFRDASTKAVDPRSEVLAHWHIALVWMLNRSVPGALASLDRARRAALHGALAARDDWTHPGEQRFVDALQQSLTGAERTWLRLVGMGMEDRREAAGRQLRRQLGAVLAEALELVAMVQATYAAIGRPAAECAAPALLKELPASGDFTDFPEIGVSLAAGGAPHLVFGYHLAVHEVRVADLSALRPNGRWRVDVECTVGAPGGAEPVQVELIRLGAGGPPQPPGPLAYQRATVEELRPLPEPRLLPGGQAAAGHSVVRLPDGTHRRGWLRLENVQQPEAIGFRLRPYGRRNEHDQGLLAVYALR
ncbi:hypothetical protein [Catellatospora sp. NPDC049609]|uniref:hypothetical protein n=1 Tax=Catellatospora sp. NPDC049609 TaxID=3155505 RepID=UPI00342C679C